MTGTSPTRREHMLYVTALEFQNQDTMFAGFHWPLIAARVAYRLHAPELTTVYEAGIVEGGIPEFTPTSTTEVGAFDNHAEMYGNTLDTLQTFLKLGRLDGAVVDAANVDRYGNVNSSAIGAYDNPDVRLPGPGGARDILSYCEDVTLICGSTDPQRYQQRVDYISSPGHLDGDGTRDAAGFRESTGPASLVTPFGKFVFDETGRAQLDTLTTQTTVSEIEEVTGWDCVDGAEYPQLPLPTERELDVIRDEIERAQERGYRAIRS